MDLPKRATLTDRAVPDREASRHRAGRRPDISDDDCVTIIDFIYTRCTSICSVLSISYQKMQPAIVYAHLTKQVRLVKTPLGIFLQIYNISRRGRCGGLHGRLPNHDAFTMGERMRLCSGVVREAADLPIDVHGNAPGAMPATPWHGSERYQR